MMRNRLHHALILASALIASAAIAGPNEVGFQTRFAPIPDTLSAYGYGSVPNNGLLGGTWSPGSQNNNSINSVFVGQMQPAGGKYGGGAQTAYFPFTADVIQRGQGQGGGFLGFVRGLGKGNAFFGDGGAECYNGGEQPPPDSTSECSANGEYEADEGQFIFSGTLASYTAGATTISYTSAVNESVAGARAFFNANHKYTTGSPAQYTLCFEGTDITPTGDGAGNSVCPTPHCPYGAGSECTVVDFSGSTLPTTNSTGRWYFKAGATNDNYAPACVGDDVQPGGVSNCVGHWYQVSSIVSTTRIILTHIWDFRNLGRYVGGAYELIEGVEALDANPTTKTSTAGLAPHSLIIPSNFFSWSNGDTIYSPPSHFHGITGVNLITRKWYKTGRGPLTDEGVRVYNPGPAKMDVGVHVSGNFDGTGGYEAAFKASFLNPRTTGPTGIKFNDTRALDVEGAVNYLLTSNVNGSMSPPSALVCLGSIGNSCMYGSGTAMVFDGTAIKIDYGVHNDGGGLKFASVQDTSSLAASTRRDETVTWTTPWFASGYVPTCTVTETSGFVTVVAVKTQATGTMTVTVQNTDSSSSHGGAGGNAINLNCHAMYPQH